MAADRGILYAQYYIGHCYSDGIGVPKDSVVAYMWLNIASAAGNAEAKKGREAIEGQMTRDEISEGQKLSREWKPTKPAD